MDAPASQFVFERTPDRAMAMAIAGLACYLLGCSCGMVMGILVLPLWLAAGGLGYYGFHLAKQAKAEIEEGRWDAALQSKADLGSTLGIISACLGGGTTLLLGGLFCAGMFFYIVMIVFAGATGGF